METKNDQTEYLETIRDCIAMLMVLKGSPADLKAASKAFAWVMARNSVSSQELKDACAIAMETLKFFPAPSEILDIVRERRQTFNELEKAMRVESLRACRDADGMPWAAPERFIDGETYIGPIPALGEPINAPELPEGSAPALEMRSEVADRLKQLEGRYKRVTKRNRPVLPEGETVNIEGERERQIRQARGIQG